MADFILENSERSVKSADDKAQIDSLQFMLRAPDGLAGGGRLTDQQVLKGNLPGLSIDGDPLAESGQILSRLKNMTDRQQIDYARSLCDATFTANPRFQAVIEKGSDADGNEEPRLVDLDLVETAADGRVSRIDLFNTARGASQRADYVQKVSDTVNPAVKAFEDMRSIWQKGTLISDSTDPVLSPPTKVSGNEVGLSIEFAEQLKKELAARGFSEDFVNDALAAFRHNSFQHNLENNVLGKEIDELKKQTKKTPEDKQKLKDMEEYKKLHEKAQDDWQLKKQGLQFIH